MTTAVDPLPLTGRRIARNSLWNIAGQGTPLLLAFVTIPLLMKGMGTERFGILTLTWMVIGYFGIFDLGLGRALTKSVATAIGREAAAEIPYLAWTGLSLMALLGLAGGVTVWLLSPWLVSGVLKIPGGLRGEALDAFRYLALSVPFVIVTSGVVGIFEAHQAFAIINRIRIGLGIFTYLGPLLVLPFSAGIAPVVALLCVGRVAACLLYLALCQRTFPPLRRVRLSREMIRPLLSFGGWMTVSNVISPVMVYIDRFLIGAVVSVSAVAFYATPYEMVTKVWILPNAVMAALFPALAALSAEPERAALLIARAADRLFLLLFPLLFALALFAREVLSLWLGPGFAGESSFVLQALAAGVFANSIARIPYTLLQSAGRPDVTAKIHLLELPVYLPIVWWCTHNFGIGGAAVAWTGRAVLDAALLNAATFRLLPESRRFTGRSSFAASAALVAFGAGVAFVPEVPGRVAAVSVALLWAFFSVRRSGGAGEIPSPGEIPAVSKG